MSAPELKPCPFCGKKAKLVRGGPGNVFVQCQWCMASTDDGSKERAIERWNRRAPDPDLIAEFVAREREGCAQVIHEEQAVIWTQEIMEALAMNGHIDPQTYDDKVEIARLIRDELEVIPAAIRARGQG